MNFCYSQADRYLYFSDARNFRCQGMLTSILNLLACIGLDRSPDVSIQIQPQLHVLRGNEHVSVQLDQWFRFSEQFYMKLMRKVLDHLYNTYHDYQKVLNSKLLFFHNVMPGRLKHFSLHEAEKLIQIVSGISSASMLHTELQLLQATVDNCNGVGELIQTLESIGGGYPNASLLYTYLLTLPITVASNERSFSKMKLLKNRLRSTLTADKFENLMLCAVEKDVLDTANLSVLADEWAARKKRRVVISKKHVSVS